MPEQKEYRFDVRDKTGGKLKKKFKLLCYKKDRHMEDVINELVEEWVRENEH